MKKLKSKKHQPSPPKEPSPPPSSSEEEVEEEEKEEEISTPLSSQPSKKSTSHPSQTVKPHPSSSSSSSSSSEEEEEEEEEEGEKEEEEKGEEIGPEENEEETEDSESEKAKYIATPSKPALPKKQKKEEEEEEPNCEEELGLSSGSESSPHPKSKKSDKKEGSGAKSNENGSSKRQRPVAKTKEGDGKEKEEEEKKYQPYSRIWSPEDLITLLKGMLEFAEKGPSDAYSDATGFHKFISKSLNVEVTKRQLVRKIRHTRDKYKTQLEKVREGKALVFCRPHDKLVYQLSKKLWSRKYASMEDDDDEDDGMEVENGTGVDTLNMEEKGGSTVVRKRGSTAVRKGGGNVKRMSTTKEKDDGNAKRRRKNADERLEQKSPELTPKRIGLEEPVQNDNNLFEEVKNGTVLYPHLIELLCQSGILGSSGLLERDVKRAFQLMSPSQVEKWNQCWMKLQLKERDIQMERLSLAFDMTKQCHDLVKSSEL